MAFSSVIAYPNPSSLTLILYKSLAWLYIDQVYVKDIEKLRRI